MCWLVFLGQFIIMCVVCVCVCVFGVCSECVVCVCVCGVCVVCVVCGVWCVMFLYI